MSSVDKIQEASDALKMAYFELRLDPHAPRTHQEAADSAQESLTDTQRDALKGYNLQAYLKDQYLTIVYGYAFRMLQDQNPEGSKETLHQQAMELLQMTDEFQSMDPREQERFSSRMLTAETLADMKSVCLPSKLDPKVDEGIKTFRNVLRHGLQDKGLTLPPDCSEAFPQEPDQAVHNVVLELQRRQGQKQIPPEDLFKGIQNFLRRPDVQALAPELPETNPGPIIAASLNANARQPVIN